MGTVKTFQAISKLKHFLEKRSRQSVEIYVPRHDLADEYIDLLSGINAKVIHIRPRTGGAAGKLPVLCERSEYAKSQEEQGSGIFSKACRSRESSECEYFQTCEYIAQFNDSDLGEPISNVVRIYVHNYRGLSRKPLQQNPSIAIIDDFF